MPVAGLDLIIGVVVTPCCWCVIGLDSHQVYFTQPGVVITPTHNYLPSPGRRFLPYLCYYSVYTLTPHSWTGTGKDITPVADGWRQRAPCLPFPLPITHKFPFTLPHLALVLPPAPT